jgi:hypothetical protein
MTSSSTLKLNGHKENTAPVLLAVCVLRALPSNGFTCYINNTDNNNNNNNNNNNPVVLIEEEQDDEEEENQCAQMVTVRAEFLVPIRFSLSPIVPGPVSLSDYIRFMMDKAYQSR